MAKNANVKKLIMSHLQILSEKPLKDSSFNGFFNVQISFSNLLTF